MQVALTNSSATTKGFFSKASDDLLPPISLTKDTLNWPLVHDPEGEVNLENWHLSSSDNSTPLFRSSARRTFPTNIQNFPLPSAMSRLEGNPAERGTAGAQRWRISSKGQFVDQEARGWDLADDMTRLKLGEVGVTAEEVPVQTPPKSKLAVAQLGEGSPLNSSSTSAGSSPQTPDHQIAISHSRGSSTDTSISSPKDSSANNTLQAHAQMQAITSAEAKERPHSFNGGFSSVDLRRLQQANDINDADIQKQQSWMHGQQYLDGSNTSELSYPSLANHIHGPQPQPHPNLYRTGLQANSAPRAAVREDGVIDYGIRDYATMAQSTSSAPALTAYGPGQHGGTAGLAYRQPPRAYPQQGLIGSPSMGYQGSHHAAHLSLGNTQQLYEIMLPGLAESHPAIARVQQQHNAFRPTHHHSASDPSAMRDPATVALLTSNIAGFAAQPLPYYPHQYFGSQDTYPRPDVTAVQLMAARLQQFGSAYGATQANDGVDTTVQVGPQGSPHQPGPSANNRKLNLYKTELCRSWEEKGTCRYGAKCQFAHGEDELRKVSRHPKYKTEICRTFWVSGSCPYGKRCCFIHTEVPTSGNSNAGSSAGAESSGASQPNTDGRARSMSTNSDPNDTSVSLLARISAKRNHETNNSTPIDNGVKNISFSRPPTGSLRVDTSSLDGPSVKQNKSAYPSFASNGILLPAVDHITAKSPGPVTAGPDLGRHNAARLEIVGYNPRPTKTSPTSNNNIRHSFNGSDVDLNFKQTPPASQTSFNMSSMDTVTTPRASGHVRAGSAGNWGGFSRSGHLSAFPGSSQAGEIIANTPWSSADLAIGSTRLTEKAWA